MKTITITTDDEFNTTLNVVETIDGVESNREATDDDKAEAIALAGGYPESTVTALQDQLVTEKQQWIDSKDALNAAHRRAIETVRAERQSEVDSLKTELEEALNDPSPVVSGGVTKLTIKRRLDALGPEKWPMMKAALSTFPESLQDEWTLAQEILVTDPMFVANADAFKSLLGLTDEQFTALLTP